MKWKLRKKTYRFNYACYLKLEKKEREGFFGYDGPKNKEMLEKGFMDHIEKGFEQDNLIDLSNYCNFLWNLIEDQREIKNVK